VASSLFRLRGKSAFALRVLCLLLFARLGFGAVPGFAPQQRMGFTYGDQWEPSIAADSYGHVYILYPQYGSVPDCAKCSVPSMVFQMSHDNGATWQAPRPMAPRSAQFDGQIVVDPADRQTVYASWLENDKHDVALAKSIDFGETWSIEIAVRTPAEIDRPVLAVRGRDLYLAYGQGRELLVAASHDGGLTFASTSLNPNPILGASLAGGGAVDLNGNVYFAWTGFLSAGPKAPVILYVGRSGDGGKTWNNTLLDISAPPPDCSAQKCGWAFLGAQITMTADRSGTLYALWNSSRTVNGVERIYFASSTNGGATWSQKQEVSGAAAGVEHAFPAIVAGETGDVRIAWMDTRSHSLWNTYTRSSTNGGATWSAENKLSSAVPGYSYIQPNGFLFPFGDYFALSIDGVGQTHAVWGEGKNYESPGSIWYTNGR